MQKWGFLKPKARWLFGFRSKQKLVRILEHRLVELADSNINMTFSPAFSSVPCSWCQRTAVRVHVLHRRGPAQHLLDGAGPQLGSATPVPTGRDCASTARSRRTACAGWSHRHRSGSAGSPRRSRRRSGAGLDLRLTRIENRSSVGLARWSAMTSIVSWCRPFKVFHQFLDRRSSEGNDRPRHHVVGPVERHLALHRAPHRACRR